MTPRHLIAALLITSSVLLPLEGARAQFGLGSVPVIDENLVRKEVGVSVFGVAVPGTSMDSLLIMVSKKLISRIVDSTVKWINSGFDGNPAYVHNPSEYFSNIADGVAGEFIQGSDLGFLCSPFQASIKLSLTTQYYEPKPFQCTLTEVIGNIENFYDDFSQGGWDAWFSMTQEPTNNPYGAYLKAKIELDSRLASAIGIKQEQLSWGKGFLSFEKCPPNSVTITDPNSGGEKCTDTNGAPVNKTITTPGTVIEGQLSNVLGTGVRQLELADEFDELVGALVSQLLERTIFNSTSGLRGAASDYEANQPGVPPTNQPNQCPIPTEPSSVCENVDRDLVLGILNKYEPSNPGIEQAILEVQTVYPQAFIVPHNTGTRALDKIDFGGGLVVDVIIGAINPGVGQGWTWGVDCECGGPPTVPTEPPTNIEP